MSPAERQRRFERIQSLGCLPCRMRGWHNPPEIHHLNLGEHAGAPRRGDEFTIGLCCYHHRGAPLQTMTQSQCQKLLGPSMALKSKQFREVFGKDDALLAKQNALIETAERNVVGRVVA